MINFDGYYEIVSSIILNASNQCDIAMMMNHESVNKKC